ACQFAEPPSGPLTSESFSEFVTSSTAWIATGLSDLFPGENAPPLKTHTFPRHTYRLTYVRRTLGGLRRFLLRKNAETPLKPLSTLGSCFKVAIRFLRNVLDWQIFHRQYFLPSQIYLFDL